MDRNTRVPRLRGADFSYRYFHQCFIVVFTILAIAVMSIVNESFRTLYNYGNLMNSCFALMLAAMGQFLVILTSGIDISVGSMVTLGNCFSVWVMTKLPTVQGAILCLALTILLGLACGALNGLFVAVFRLPAIIVTIATSAIFQGIALVLMPVPGGNVNPEFAKAVTQKVFSRTTPMSFIYMIIIVTILAFVTNRTSFGTSIRAIGGNESAAYATGVKVTRTKMLTYMLCGLLCALGGLYLSCRTYTGDTSIGNSYTVYSISATVVGGTLMTGAVGQSYGTACGAIIIYLVNSVINMLNISTHYQYACQGAILIFALMVGSFETRRRGQ